MTSIVGIQTKPAPSCPDCGAKMVLRHRKSDRQPFWGCNRFPDCRGVRNIDPETGKPEEDYEEWENKDD